MIRALFALVAAGALTSVALAADQTFALTGENTKITFVGTKPGGKHDGGFAKLSGTATVTDGNPQSLRIMVDIDTGSLYADDPKLATHLKSPDFFAVKDHPKATFKTTKVEKSGTGYTVSGELTMLGKTKPVSFPATVAVSGNTLTLSAEFKINRTDWGMNFGKGMIDDLVTVKVAVNAKA
jgi:polyisoprenoid-binding protein YceI